MRRVFKTTAGIIFAALILIGAGSWFVVNLATRSLPLRDGETTVEGIRDSVHIHRNRYGIPHIIASSDEDLFFGVGYAHAQDRMWQLDLGRRYGQGRLAEILGRDALDVDVFTRHVDFAGTAAKLYRYISDDSRMALDAYARGVNAWLHEHHERLPFEFDALGYEPEEWKGEHSLILGRLMSWEMCLSFWTDAALGEVAARYGSGIAEELIPRWPADAPTVTDVDNPPVSPSLTNKIGFEKTRQYNPPEFDGAFAETWQYVREFYGIKGTAAGSNSWAVRAAGTDKRAILANDPHLTLMMPPRWYQAHLTSPGINAAGLTIPGLPFVVVGRNDAIAWGVTNIMLDDCDLFVEKLDTSNRRRYHISEFETAEFKFRTDTIHVKDSIPAVIRIRSTERSALISDAHLFRHPELVMTEARADTGAAAFYRRKALSFRWTGYEMSDEILAMYRLQKAHNWDRFLRALSIFTTPALNFSYADTAGNVGVVPTANVPKRGSNNPNLPARGWVAEEDWQGMHPPTDLPHLYNPERPYVFSANNLTARNLPFHVSALWEPSSRARRIDELLSQLDIYTAADVSFMQMDLISPHARELTPILTQALSDSLVADTRNYDETERAAITLLNQWDYSMHSGSAAAAIFNVLLERLVYETFHDELGDQLYYKLTFVSNVPMRLILQFAHEADNPWFDDRRTLEKEERDAIIRRAFHAAIKQLRQDMDSDDAPSWNWGAIHQVEVPHLFGEQAAMRTLVNLGPFPADGNVTTINNSEWRFYDPYTVRTATSMRFVADMRDSVVRTILPGGNSGQALSPHYANQMQLWRTGGFATIPMSRRHHPGFDETLHLVPARDER